MDKSDLGLALAYAYPKRKDIEHKMSLFFNDKEHWDFLNIFKGYNDGIIQSLHDKLLIEQQLIEVGNDVPGLVLSNNEEQESTQILSPLHDQLLVIPEQPDVDIERALFLVKRQEEARFLRSFYDRLKLAITKKGDIFCVPPYDYESPPETLQSLYNRVYLAAMTPRIGLSENLVPCTKQESPQIFQCLKDQAFPMPEKGEDDNEGYIFSSKGYV